jgi:predicted peptidase
MRFFVLLLTFLIPAGLTSNTFASVSKKKVKTAKVSRKAGKASSSKGKVYHYLSYTPQGYDSLKDSKWPLIIYLHGKSASGSNLEKVRRYGVTFYLDRGMKLPAVVVAPQCPSGKNWDTESWFPSFYADILSKYKIDTTRIYLIGMSMGGFGCWQLGIKYPHRFATIVPFCGGYFNAPSVKVLKDVPIWVFHGDRDRQVPIRRSNVLVDELRKDGGNPRFTILKGAGHDIHRQFADMQIYDWMLKYKVGEKLKPEDVKATDTVLWKTK